jgi:bacterioferritin
LLETHKHDVGSILKESLESEQAGLALYRDLLRLVEGKCVALEEYSREMILAEELHSSEVEKMLRQPPKG